MLLLLSLPMAEDGKKCTTECTTLCTHYYYQSLEGIRSHSDVEDPDDVAHSGAAHWTDAPGRGLDMPGAAHAHGHVAARNAHSAADGIVADNAIALGAAIRLSFGLWGLLRLTRLRG